jgi:L-ectoine synthase
MEVPARMGEKIRHNRLSDTPRTWLHVGNEYSQRVVTQRREGCESFSFHITTYEPNFDVMVRGDGVHEVVLFCLEGDSRQLLEDGSEVHFEPGMAMYLPRRYTYRHVIGPKGLVVAVACNPPRE